MLTRSTTDRLNQLINPHVRKQPWYRFLSSPATGVPYLLTVHAVGKLTANRVVVRKLVASRVSANVELNKGKLRLSDLRGDVLGGKHVGDWEADFTAKPPAYSGSGTLERIALESAFREHERRLDHRFGNGNLSRENIGFGRG